MAVAARFLILIVLLISIADGRILSLNSSGDHQLISDGINGGDSTNLSCCQHQYGFMPCAENAAGYLVLIVAYQVLMIVGDKLMDSGSVAIFNNSDLGPKIGGIIFRILRALPSMMVIIITGIFSDKEKAQSQVSVIVGVYAGITVFGLTLQWCMCVVFASQPLKKGSDEHKHEHEQTSDTRECFPIMKQKLRSLIGNGVCVDEDTCRTAKIMLLSLIPYVVLQLVYAFETSSGKRIMTLIALVVSFFSLVSYFVYQIRDPWMQERSLDYSKFDIVQKGLIQYVATMGKLLNDDGTLNSDLIKGFFDEADKDDNQCITGKELENMVSKIFRAGAVNINHKDVTNDILNKLDNNKDNRISEDEIMDVFERWINEAKHPSSNKEGRMGFCHSVFAVLLGLAMITFLGSPLMSNILELSNATELPSYAVSFFFVPFALNGRVALAALLPASKKTRYASSRTFSEIYSGVIMNNIAGLTTLLTIVFAKDLVWDSSAEVLTIMVVCALIGTHAFLSKTYPLWTCIPALLLYPISLVLFYFSQVFFGWN